MRLPVSDPDTLSALLELRHMLSQASMRHAAIGERSSSIPEEAMLAVNVATSLESVAFSESSAAESANQIIELPASSMTIASLLLCSLKRHIGHL